MQALDLTRTCGCRQNEAPRIFSKRQRFCRERALVHTKERVSVAQIAQSASPGAGRSFGAFGTGREMYASAARAYMDQTVIIPQFEQVQASAGPRSTQAWRRIAKGASRAARDAPSKRGFEAS